MAKIMVVVVVVVMMMMAGAQESEVDDRTEYGRDGGNDGLAETEDDDGNQADNNNAGTVYWAQFIHQCIDLRQAHIELVYLGMNLGMDVASRSRI
jgi:hypothetical protein